MLTVYDYVVAVANETNKSSYRWFENRHIEKDSHCLISYRKHVFLMQNKARPLTEHNKMSLCRLIQDDSEIGKQNKRQHKDHLDKLFLVKKISDGKIMSTPLIDEYCFRFEIIANHCPRGSNFWALWQMYQGKAIKHISFPDGYYYRMQKSYLGDTVYDTWGNKWDAVCFTHGSQELHRFIKGGRPPNDGKSMRAVGGNIYFRGKFIPSSWTSENSFANIMQCGYKTIKKCFHIVSTQETENLFDLVEASLEPDFSSAKAGDECYSSAGGVCIIAYVDMKDKPEIMVNCSGRNGYYHVNGKYATIDIHPTLFHSAAQCAAYFAEVALKERGEE